MGLPYWFVVRMTRKYVGSVLNTERAIQKPSIIPDVTDEGRSQNIQVILLKFDCFQSLKHNLLFFSCKEPLLWLNGPPSLGPPVKLVFLNRIECCGRREMQASIANGCNPKQYFIREKHHLTSNVDALPHLKWILSFHLTFPGSLPSAFLMTKVDFFIRAWHFPPGQNASLRALPPLHPPKAGQEVLSHRAPKVRGSAALYNDP